MSTRFFIGSLVLVGGTLYFGLFAIMSAVGIPLH